MIGQDQMFIDNLDVGTFDCLAKKFINKINKHLNSDNDLEIENSKDRPIILRRRE
jgi:hypothetical protein